MARWVPSRVAIILAALLPLLAIRPPVTSVAAADTQCFAETGKCLSGRFYQYWTANGGLAQQGLPLTDEFSEVNPTNGQTYQVQYFERARFESHPENQAPYDILLGLLGREQFFAKYPNGRPGGGTGDLCFSETGYCISGRFAAYWQSHGGLAQQGLPISPEFDEVNPTNGQTYRTQYFERARFEYHPENAAPNDVLLGLLGREQLFAKNPPHPSTVIFQDDFSNSDSGWTTGSNDTGNVHYAGRDQFGNVLDMFINQPNVDQATYNAKLVNLADTSVEVDVIFAGARPSENPGAGVICRAQNNDNMYLFVILSQGTYGIFKMNQGTLIPLVQGTTPSATLHVGSTSSGPSINRIRADCMGKTLTLSANGQQLAQVDDTDFSIGSLGLYGISVHTSEGAEFWFRNFVVSKP